MSDPEKITSWLRKRLPFLELPKNIGRDLLAQRVTALRMVKCEPYHFSEGRAVLIGDAAHATPPAIGQGCNSSLVDAAVLARLLLGEKVGEDDRLEVKEKKEFGFVLNDEGILKSLPGVLERYSALQVSEGHALVDLSDSEGPLDNHVVFWHTLRNFYTGALSKLFPWFVSPPVMFMAGMGVNFSEIRRLHATEVDKILASNARVKATWREAQVKKLLQGGS